MRPLARLVQILRRDRRHTGRDAAPGPHNTTTLVFTDPVARAQDGPDVVGEAAGPDTAFQGEPLIRWVVRTAQAASHQVRVLVPGDPAAEPLADDVFASWWSLLPRSTANVAGGRAKGVAALGLWPSGEASLDRRPRLATVLTRIEDPYVLLLDARMPTLGPDLLLALHSRLSGHDAVAFHLDGWWVAEPSLWRRAALVEAVAAAAEAGHRDLPALFDLVDARPLDEGFLAAVTAEARDLRTLHTTHEVARHEADRQR